jgi:hypothetical protein
LIFPPRPHASTGASNAPSIEKGMTVLSRRVFLRAAAGAPLIAGAGSWLSTASAAELKSMLAKSLDEPN